jgi:hypothetical protein
MKTGFPKFHDGHDASSIFEWLFEVKVTELGLNPENTKAKEVQEFRSFWSREVAAKLWEVIGRMYGSSSPWDSMSNMLHIWAACRLDKITQCKRSQCGRFFFSSKSTPKYCDAQCRQKDVGERYDTDEYREKKKLAMRRRRAALKALREAKFNAMRPKR